MAGAGCVGAARQASEQLAHDAQKPIKSPPRQNKAVP